MHWELKGRRPKTHKKIFLLSGYHWNYHDMTGPFTVYDQNLCFNLHIWGRPPLIPYLPPSSFSGTTEIESGAAWLRSVPLQYRITMGPELLQRKLPLRVPTVALPSSDLSLSKSYEEGQRLVRGVVIFSWSNSVPHSNCIVTFDWPSKKAFPDGFEK